MPRGNAVRLLLVGVVSVGLLAGCAGAGSLSVSPSATAPAPSASPLYDDPYHLTIGQCFDPIEDKDDQTLLAVSLKSCDEAHLVEMIGIRTLPDGGLAPYPGDSQVADAAEKGCLSTFSHYVGIEYGKSRLLGSFYGPTPESWAAGDRLVLCTVIATEIAPLTRSVKGSRQ